MHLPALDPAASPNISPPHLAFWPPADGSSSPWQQALHGRDWGDLLPPVRPASSPPRLPAAAPGRAFLGDAVSSFEHPRAVSLPAARGAGATPAPARRRAVGRPRLPPVPRDGDAASQRLQRRRDANRASAQRARARHDAEIGRLERRAARLTDHLQQARAAYCALVLAQPALAAAAAPPAAGARQAPAWSAVPQAGLELLLNDAAAPRWLTAPLTGAGDSDADSDGTWGSRP